MSLRSTGDYFCFIFMTSADRSYGFEYPFLINQDLLSYAIDFYSIETLRSMQLILLLFVLNTII
jgi:hypothetical protein